MSGTTRTVSAVCANAFVSMVVRDETIGQVIEVNAVSCRNAFSPITVSTDSAFRSRTRYILHDWYSPVVISVVDGDGVIMVDAAGGHSAYTGAFVHIVHNPSAINIHTRIRDVSCTVPIVK